jgi:DNA adenine methylase
MPKHEIYCEPYLGGGAVLLAKDPSSTAEIVNDKDARLTNMWSVLRTPDLFQAFARRCQATPFSEPLFRDCAKFLDETVLVDLAA